LVQSSIAERDRVGECDTGQIAMVDTLVNHVLHMVCLPGPQGDRVSLTGLDGQRRAPSASTSDQ